jgi:hypothetical protein
VNVYKGQELLRQEMLFVERPRVTFDLPAPQSTLSLMLDFIGHGAHHLLIGADHVLFLLGLLLLGGNWLTLAKIITSFTVAHSLTLGLATLRIFAPPASVVEPIIALSIVFVGAQVLFFQSKRDPRLILAFGFGLVHGFGFAGVLQDMGLPPHALGWSLFSFNLGVELGQLALVAALAPLLALLQNKQPAFARHFVPAAAMIVSGAGAFWFFQRVMVS